VKVYHHGLRYYIQSASRRIFYQKTLIIREQENGNLVDSRQDWPAAMTPQRSRAFDATGDLFSESGSKKGTVVFAGGQGSLLGAREQRKFTRMLPPVH
jgi:hypothetical protein